MPANHVLLETIYLTQSAASVTFDNIPQTGYTDLKIVASTRSPISGYGTDMTLAFNGSTANFSGRRIYGYSATAYSDTQSNVGGLVVGGTATASTFATNELYIYDYTSSNNKSYSMEAVSENNSTTAYLLELSTNFWTNTAAITSITFGVSTSTFSPYSSFSLYGIASTGTTPTVGPKAQGGNIVANDGTYWYHAFLSSGTFTPTVALTADVLVIAGGGAGGGSYAGGGGAGGVCYQTGRSIPTTSYSVTVGAGGASNTTSSQGANGTNTIFDTITAVGGGGGGYWSTTSFAGSSGGSGGGSGMGSNNGQTGAGGGAATQGSSGGATGYGNAGGNGYRAPADAAYLGGGGGGAGAAGGNASTSSPWNAGSGGAGLNTWSAWASATTTGVSGYYAGGGGGAGDNAAASFGSGGSGGGGNGGKYNSSAAVSGTVNTGSGGGGASGTSGAGGSGIVIIRYTMA